MGKLFISVAIVVCLMFGGGVSSFATDTKMKGNTHESTGQYVDDSTLTTGISGKSTVQKNEEGINKSYLGCLMFDSDNNPVQKCSDLRWGSEQALYNNMKTPSNITVEDLKKATPPNTGEE
jgi:hypothetical protein